MTLCPQTCCVELYTDTQLLWLFLIHQCFHVWCWKCFGIHLGDIFLKIEKWPFIYRRSKLTLFAQHLDLEMWMSPSFFMETWMYGNSKSLRLGHSRVTGVHGARRTEICKCLRLLPLSSTETGLIKLWMINLDVPHIVRDTHHVLIRRFLGKY